MNRKTTLQIFLCKYIKVIVILTGIDRESNGSYALLFSFTSLFTQNWMHFVKAQCTLSHPRPARLALF